MLYVLRDETNAIVALSEKALTTEWQRVNANDPGLKEFLEQQAEFGSLIMNASDLDFIRVLEDLIELMMDKNMISFTDFPAAAQKKLLTRRGYREQIRGNSEVSLIAQEEDLL